MLNAVCRVGAVYTLWQCQLYEWQSLLNFVCDRNKYVFERKHANTVEVRYWSRISRCKHILFVQIWTTRLMLFWVNFFSSYCISIRKLVSVLVVVLSSKRLRIRTKKKKINKKVTAMWCWFSLPRYTKLYGNYCNWWTHLLWFESYNW